MSVGQVGMQMKATDSKERSSDAIIGRSIQRPSRRRNRSTFNGPLFYFPLYLSLLCNLPVGRQFRNVYIVLIGQ